LQASAPDLGRHQQPQEAHMSIIAIGLSIATSTVPYVEYPSLNARPTVNDRARVEAVTDLGPVQELIVKCPAAGTAIISYSKIDKMFCGAGNQCSVSLPIMVRKVCK
jgi:hypothetical protein